MVYTLLVSVIHLVNGMLGTSCIALKIVSKIRISCKFNPTTNGCPTIIQACNLLQTVQNFQVPLHRSYCTKTTRNNIKSTSTSTRVEPSKWDILTVPVPPKVEYHEVKRKVALKVAFTGTGYHGFQKLTSEYPTIESALEDALYKAGFISEENYGFLNKIAWSRSSRTDKGVHSLATLVGVRLYAKWKRNVHLDGVIEYDIEEQTKELPEKINQFLPKDIRILAAAPVKDSWNAKIACVSRLYEYLLPYHVLQSTVYEKEKHIFDRLLNRFVGRHHWHNYGFVDKSKLKSMPIPSMMQRYATFEERQAKFEKKDSKQKVELESQQQKDITDTPTHSVYNRVENVQSFISKDQEEPSLWKATTKDPNSSRPSLYALDEFKKQLLEKNDKESNSTLLTVDHPNFTIMPPIGTPSEFCFSDPKEIADTPLTDYYCQDSFHRTIHSVFHDLVEIEGDKFVRISIVGESFLLHQVRKMVGMLVAVCRGIVSEETFIASIDSPFKILTPRAPSQGLLLRDAQFCDVNFTSRDLQPGFEFARQHIYPHLRKKWVAVDKWMSIQSAQNSSLETGNAQQKIDAQSENSLDSSQSIDHKSNLTSMDALEEASDDKESQRLDDVAITDNPWHELNSMVPIRQIRDIIPYDNWISMHSRELDEQEIRANRKRASKELQEQLQEQRNGRSYNGNNIDGAADNFRDSRRKGKDGRQRSRHTSPPPPIPKSPSFNDPLKSL